MMPTRTNKTRADHLREIIDGAPVPGLLTTTRETACTDRQLQFVHHFTNGARSAADAARAAGFADPGTAARRLILTPHVRAAIRAARIADIEGDLSRLALDTLRDLMATATTPAPVKLGAARFALEMARYGPEQAAKQPDDQKPLAEMTIAELEALVTAKESALPSADARPVPADDPQTPGEAPR
jgi:hypothetical protein